MRAAAVHIITIPASPENDALLESLARVPGVTVEGRRTASDYLSLQEGAELCKINYFTFRSWVVEKKMIPFSRPSGRGKGDIRVKRADVLRLLDGQAAKKKPGRKGREVKILG